MEDFKVGDLVTCKINFSGNYAYTIPGVVCEVVDVKQEGQIVVKIPCNQPLIESNMIDAMDERLCACYTSSVEKTIYDYDTAYTKIEQPWAVEIDHFQKIKGNFFICYENYYEK